MRRKGLFIIMSLCLLLASYPSRGCAQFVYGNTGLLHLPTAEMQKDKTVMLGGAWLAERAIPDSHNYGWDRDGTFNYFLNVTFFPWLEISYTCTLIRGKYLAEHRGLNPKDFNYWANQDRHLDFRLRVWKEGWWKSWTPQIVIGMNDFLHTFGESNLGMTDSGNGYWSRIYVAATKHEKIPGVGEMGAHVAYMYNERKDFLYDGMGVGVNFRLNGLQTSSEFLNKSLKGLNLMMECDSRTMNAGASYSFWKDFFHVVFEMNDLKYFSGGIYCKLHLK